MNSISKNSTAHSTQRNPVLVPLGDRGLLVRFGTELDLQTNATAVMVAKELARHKIVGILEICPSLVSVFIRYAPLKTNYMQLCHQVRLVLSKQDLGGDPTVKNHKIDVTYGGRDGPDLGEVCDKLKISPLDFVSLHNQSKLSVMAIGFSPGFTYCGLHSSDLHIPRREHLHASVPPGSIIFAAGQTAITATDVPTGWHVIGRTSLRNFDENLMPPTQLHPGDRVTFEGGLFNDKN